jgi:hypothetical protein
VIEEQPKGRKARAAAKRSGPAVADPRSVTIKTQPKPDAQPPTTKPSEE